MQNFEELGPTIPAVQSFWIIRFEDSLHNIWKEVKVVVSVCFTDLILYKPQSSYGAGACQLLQVNSLCQPNSTLV